MPTTRQRPPGLKAPRRATPAQRAAVGKVISKHQDEVLNLGLSESEAFMPVLDKAQAELAAQLARWVESTPGGELSWKAQSYRNALAQVHYSQRALHEKMRVRLDGATSQAQDLAIDHLTEQVARFSEIFGGSVAQLSVQPAVLIASGKSWQVARFESSSLRYAGMVGKDMQQRLAIDILKGDKVQDTIKRLQESGGPRGLVNVGGDSLEDIPEGLFARYRFWGERLVRTEVSSAYGMQSRDGRRAAGELVKDLRKKWVCDASACKNICDEMSDQVVDESDLFAPAGISDAPAHPFCGCCVVPWHNDWPELLGDIFE